MWLCPKVALVLSQAFPTVSLSPQTTWLNVLLSKATPLGAVTTRCTNPCS